MTATAPDPCTFTENSRSAFKPVKFNCHRLILAPLPSGEVDISSVLWFDASSTTPLPAVMSCAAFGPAARCVTEGAGLLKAEQGSIRGVAKWPRHVFVCQSRGGCLEAKDAIERCVT